MKIPCLLGALIFGLSSAAALAAPAPKQFDVIVVTEPGGKVVFKGETDGRGSFSTGKLEAGDYVLQFKAAKTAGLERVLYSIAAVGGKRAVTARAVAGEKFAGGGVALRVQVAGGSRLAGRVAQGDLDAVQDVQAAAAAPKTKAQSSEFLRRNQELSGQGAAIPNGVVRPTGR